MSYQQLTLEEREVISQMHYSGSGPTAIARRLDSSPSTISRELRRNCSPQGYRAVTAQKQTSKRRRERTLTRKMDDPQINEAAGSKNSADRYMQAILSLPKSEQS